MTPSSDPAALDSPPCPAATRRNWLALNGFPLWFSPLVAWVLTVARSARPFLRRLRPAPAPTYAYDYTGGYVRVPCLAGLASLFGSISAVVTGRLALRQAGEVPKRQTWPALARTGSVLGILGIVADCIIAPRTSISIVSIVAQNYHGS